jgi:hypothetical protein
MQIQLAHSVIMIHKRRLLYYEAFTGVSAVHTVNAAKEMSRLVLFLSFLLYDPFFFVPVCFLVPDAVREVVSRRAQRLKFPSSYRILIIAVVPFGLQDGRTPGIAWQILGS